MHLRSYNIDKGGFNYTPLNIDQQVCIYICAFMHAAGKSHTIVSGYACMAPPHGVLDDGTFFFIPNSNFAGQKYVNIIYDRSIGLELRRTNARDKDSRASSELQRLQI